jgi:hypothetical protein
MQLRIRSSFAIRRGPPSCIFIDASLSKRSLHGVPRREKNSGLPYSKPTHYHSWALADYSVIGACGLAMTMTVKMTE